MNNETEELRAAYRAANDLAVRALERCEAAERERDALRDSAAQNWNANMRAIERWQAAHPGNNLAWPGHTDLVLWLMEQLADAQSDTRRLEWMATSWYPYPNDDYYDGIGKSLEVPDPEKLRASIDAAMEAIRG